MPDLRTITVTDCQPARRGDGTVIEGEGTYGPWTLYEIQATQDGIPIQEKMKCFKPLPVGDTISIEFDTQHDEKWGTSHTLKPIKGQKLGTPQSPGNDAIEMVRESLRMALDRIATLEAHCGLTIGRGQTDVPAAVPPAVGVGAASAMDSDEPPF